MADADKDQEPSIEEILSSIRRIISSEMEGEGVRGGDDVAPKKMVDDFASVGAQGQSLSSETKMTGQVNPDDDVLDLTVVVKEGNEVEQLSEELAPAPTGRFGDTSVGTTGNKGEEAAIQLVRPIIVEWLNNNLPSMKERFVRAEINRLAQESKRR